MSFALKASALALAVTIGLSSLAAFPVQAAPLDPTLTELKLELGLTPDMMARGQQLQTDMVKFGYDEDDVDDWCVGRDQIRTGLILAGFNDMDIVDRLSQFRVRVEALYLSDGWVYSMLVNKCTGEVSVLNPIYMAADVN